MPGVIYHLGFSPTATSRHKQVLQKKHAMLNKSTCPKTVRVKNWPIAESTWPNQWFNGSVTKQWFSVSGGWFLL